MLAVVLNKKVAKSNTRSYADIIVSCTKIYLILSGKTIYRVQLIVDEYVQNRDNIYDNYKEQLVSEWLTNNILNLSNENLESTALEEAVDVLSAKFRTFYSDLFSE